MKEFELKITMADDGNVAMTKSATGFHNHEIIGFLEIARSQFVNSVIEQLESKIKEDKK